MWDVLNKIAVIVTIIGFPAVLISLFQIIYDGIMIYDAYKEPNSAGGDTFNVGSFTRKDYRNGKKHNPKRLYHLKGYGIDDSGSWK